MTHRPRAAGHDNGPANAPAIRAVADVGEQDLDLREFDVAVLLVGAASSARAQQPTRAKPDERIQTVGWAQNASRT